MTSSVDNVAGPPISWGVCEAPARVTGHRLVAVAARDRRRGEDSAHRHGVERALRTYADVLADTDVEAIHNPLANAVGGPWNLAAIHLAWRTHRPRRSTHDHSR